MLVVPLLEAHDSTLCETRRWRYNHAINRGCWTRH